MTLSRLGRSEDVFLAEAGPAARSNRAATAGADAFRAAWHPAFDRAHWFVVVTLIATVTALAIFAPAVVSGPAAGALLLIGGALIGMPHGSSDFVVAHRLFRPRLGAWWLPIFLAGYLLVTTVVLLGWRFAPVGTFLAFLAVSGLHFGAAEAGHDGEGDTAWRYLARAATPIAPIFLSHPGEVAGIIGLMIGHPASGVAAALQQMRPAGLTVYAVLLAAIMAGALAAGGQRGDASSCLREAVELVLLALAAVLLPPLLTFAIYFCLLHAVRHMAQLGHRTFPRNGRAALGLASAVVVPSALVCSVVLGFAWDRVGGVLTTEHMLALALQVTASLTVPHVMLEWWAERQAEAA